MWVCIVNIYVVVVSSYREQQKLGLYLNEYFLCLMQLYYNKIIQSRLVFRCFDYRIGPVYTNKRDFLKLDWAVFSIRTILNQEQNAKLILLFFQIFWIN